MVAIFSEKRIVLGVTGSIAAYKAVSLASQLTQAGALVDAVLTRSACELISPVSFSSVTGRRAWTDDDLWQTADHVPHIHLGEDNDLFLIAPATANTLAKLAKGISDNLLTVSALASRTPVIVAPAMDGGMYANAATQENLKTLSEREGRILGPARGHLASGLEGKGRMLEPEQLFGHLRNILGQTGSLQRKKVVVTAGPTREAIDPVRFLSNPSTGRQGYALARAALDQGARVTLISGPCCLEPPVGSQVLRVTTAEEMLEVVHREAVDADILFMAAAVADYQPEQTAQEKIKKEGRGLSSLSLQPTEDILMAIADLRSGGSGPAVVVGFAAETEKLIGNAQEKLHRKKLDLIAANDITVEDAGFGGDRNQVTLLWSNGRVKKLPLQSKFKVAEQVVAEAVELLGG